MVRKLIFSVALGITFASAQPSLPDTPAGRTLRAWLDAVNTGDRGRMEEYTRKHEPTRPADTLVNMRIKSGGFDLIGVDESEPTRLVFQVKERSSGRTAIGKMIVKDADPPTVVSLLLRIDTPGQPRPKDIVLDAPTRAAVIEGAIAKLNENYVFPDLAKKMEQHVRERHKRGEYDKVTDGDAFAALLTDHFREISKDKHLRVNYSAAVVPEPRPGGRGPEAISAYRKQMERTNCGFDKAERLEGNIGYLKFNFFASPEVCGPTAIAAMNFLGGVDALIVDLRDNGGGEPAMIALISSYLFSEPTHLNDIYHRKDDTTSQFWTLPYVPGRRLDGKPVYVLTSSRTFSGAEEFSYNLKNLKRATIIGETTGGGAHPVSGHRIHEHFTIGVPFARAINPVSKTNWEGTGVEPDIKAPRDEALQVAIRLATEKVTAK